MSTNPSQIQQEVAREARKWLRYYQDLGFYNIARPAVAVVSSEPTPLAAQAIAPPPAEPVPVPSVVTSAPPVFTPQPPAAQPIAKEPDLPRSKPSPNAPKTSPAVTAVGSTLLAATAPPETLEAIRKDLGADCRRCKLAGGRKTIVFGSGNEKAEVIFVGEGPGADEDEQGLPFVGRAGQLLTDMIEKGMKIPRPDVYICNIVKCRPPANRKPEPDEVAACRQFVERQIMAIRPRAICALGATAAETLLGVKESMGRLRGTQYDWNGIPLVVTYHPAFLLRDPSRKADTWADLKLLMAILKK